MRKEYCSRTITLSSPVRPAAPPSSSGQNPFRTGLLTIGMPGAEQGIQAKDPTIAELLKPMGLEHLRGVPDELDL